MKSAVNPLVGTASVLLFFALLGLTVFGVVQGQEGPIEEPRPPGPHPLEASEELSTTPLPLFDEQVVVGFWLDEAQIDCRAGRPYVVVQTRDPLPAGAEVLIRPHATTPGDPQRIALQASTAEIDVGLDESMTTGYDFLRVSVSGTAPSGVSLISNALELDAADAQCRDLP